MTGVTTWDSLAPKQNVISVLSFGIKLRTMKHENNVGVSLSTLFTHGKMVFAKKDKVAIDFLRVNKRYGAKRLLSARLRSQRRNGLRRTMCVCSVSRNIVLQSWQGLKRQCGNGARRVLVRLLKQKADTLNANWTSSLEYCYCLGR